MRIEALRQRLRALGANPRHEHRVLRLWSQALPQDHGSRPIANFLPATLRAALPEIERELAALERVLAVRMDQERLIARADRARGPQSIRRGAGAPAASGGHACRSRSALACTICTTLNSGTP